MPVDGQKDTQNTSAGMQVSGEQIFKEEDKSQKVTAESDVFGKQGQQDIQSGGDKNAPANQDKAPAKTGGEENKTENKSAETSDSAKQVAANLTNVLRGDTSGVTSDAKQAVSQVTETAKETASKVASTAQKLAGDAYEKVQEQAGTTITEGKQSLADGLNTIAQNIRQFGDNLKGSELNQSGVVNATANYVAPIAQQFESLAGYLDRNDLQGFASDLKGFARRNPTLFVAAAFGAGLLVARFIKASPNQALALPEQTPQIGGRRRKKAANAEIQ